eukprot:5632339-Amphidinium_carterae.1
MDSYVVDSSYGVVWVSSDVRTSWASDTMLHWKVKWQQRSGMIRTVVRIRPPAPVEEEVSHSAYEQYTC